MSACSGSNTLSCGCTTSSLAPIDVALAESNGNFPFLSFLSGANVLVDQSTSGVVVSQRLVYDGVYVGLSPQTLSGTVVQNPVIFNDNAIFGAFNSGLYSAGIITVPVTDFYHLCCQITTDASDRDIQLIVNGVPVDGAFKISSTNDVMAICYSSVRQYTAGDIVQIRLLTNSPAPYTIGPQSYLSFRSL
jgi:hypothetical protein